MNWLPFLQRESTFGNNYFLSFPFEMGFIFKRSLFVEVTFKGKNLLHGSPMEQILSFKSNPNKKGCKAFLVSHISVSITLKSLIRRAGWPCSSCIMLLYKISFG